LPLVDGAVYNTAIGFQALNSVANSSNGNNTAVGALALANLNSANSGEAQQNTAVGTQALEANTTASNNTALGHQALQANTTGANNAAVGLRAAYANTTGEQNCAMGYRAFYSNTSGLGNVALGNAALYENTTGNNNVALGRTAGRYEVGTTNPANYNNAICLGYQAYAGGNNQVQLGNSSTTTYAYGSVQDRSDKRDKTDIRDTRLGLEFIKSLRPVDFRWDMRDDYFDDVDDERVAVPKDGSRKRNRFHHGLIAQEVKQAADEQGIDFGGYQDHKVNGGVDVLSLGYSELIAPLIKAIQEQQAVIEQLQAEVAELKAQ